MSYNLYIVPSPVPEQDGQAWDYVHAVLACRDDEDDLPAHPDFLLLIDRLDARFPWEEDGLWADGPLRDNAESSVTVLGMAGERGEEGLPFLVSAANELRLVVFDEQQGRIFRPPPVSSGTRFKRRVSDLFRVVVTGVRDGADKAAVAEKLVPLFKRSLAETLQVLNMERAVVKSRTDRSTAAKYEAALLARGCACTVEDDGLQVDLVDADSIGYVQAAARQGDANAEYELGTRHHTGRDVACDAEQALHWWQRAAEHGHAGAQYRLGAMRLHDNDGRANADAWRWLRLAAARGHAAAQCAVAVMAEQGKGMPGDPAMAARWYRRAALAGHVAASFDLGLAYHHGTGVEQDDRQAIKWYRLAAEQGDRDAQFNLAQLLWTSSEAQDVAEAVQWFRRHAEEGDANAQTSLAYCYLKGEGVALDAQEALVWFWRAAEQGNARAQMMLGMMYEEGEGTAKEPVKALHWLTRAATGGDQGAQVILGMKYRFGIGVSANRAKARGLFQSAAGQGSDAAVVQLREMHAG